MLHQLDRFETLGTLRDLRPTRRGLVVAGIAFLGFVLGATGGARSLNAVVVPALVALAAGAIQLSRAESPTVTRTTPDPGFPGETRRVTVTVDSEVPCRVTDAVGGGLSVPERSGENPTGAVGHGGSFGYEIELERRGEHEFGPAQCRLTDSLGLFSRRVETTEASSALVYPTVYEIDGTELSGLVGRVLGDERSSFDRLREFTPGDTMRDIDWRASAKRPAGEFVVAEYESRSEAARVEVVGESALGSADAMASTVASIAARLHDAGITVAVTVPAGRRVVHPGETASLLRLLALTDDGWVDRDRSAGADVCVLGKGGRANVSFDDRSLDFERLAGTDRSHGVVS